MTTAAAGTIVDQIIESCTDRCPNCDGKGSEATRPANPFGGGPGVHRISLGGRCDRCGGKGRIVNADGRRLAAFLGIQAHHLNAAPG